MENKFIELHVYDAIVDFLYDYAQRRYGYGNLQEILRELSPLPEGGTSNPATWAEWERCINRSLKEPLDAKHFGEIAKREYTKTQSFNAMVDFLIHYYKRTLSGDLMELIDIICSFPKNPTDQAVWSDWNNAAKKALQKQDIEKPINETMERELTELQSFNAMVKFLEEYYKETGSDFMGGVLGCLSFMPDGRVVDVAFWEDWGIAIKKVLHEQNSEKQIDEILGISITESQTFRVMVQLFRDYFKPDPDDPASVMFFDYLHLLADDKGSTNFTIKEQWKRCVDNVLKEKPGIRKYRIICLGKYIAPKNLN